MKELHASNGDIQDGPPPTEVVYAPLVVLKCIECPGYQEFTNHSATVVECKSCGVSQSNERIVDLNEERL